MSETRQLKTEKTTLRISLIEILALLYIMHNLLPAVGYYMPGVAYAGLFGLTMLLLLPMFRYKRAWKLSGFFMVSLLSLLINLKNPMNGALYLYGELQIYLYGLIALWLILSGDQKTCRRMLALIIVMYAITSVTTILGNDKYPQASRVMATLSSTDYLYSTYTRENIGSFTFVYELVLLTPLLIYLIRSKTIKPILGYGLLGLSAVTVFTTEYGMAVILFVASLLLLVIPKLTTRRLIILLVILLIIFLFFASFIADVFEDLSRSVESETLAERFLTVAQTLRGEDGLEDGTTGASRMEFYKKALDAFWSTACMGGWGTISTGGHSFVFDALGNYGLLGLVCLIIFFVTIYKLCLKPYRNEPFYPYALWMCLLGVVLMFMNPKNYRFIFLCVLPLFSTAFKVEKRSNENESSLDRE